MNKEGSAISTYTHGHHESVLRSHRMRTAANSAAYLLPHLHDSDSLLDIGAGPGTITIDLARIVRVKTPILRIVYAIAEENGTPLRNTFLQFLNGIDTR